ncbi:hypothetical protein Ocin01_03501 [Orchesella cincta]|uniref:Uncharacterized protein n=1 Tax=Orchesella cincta TaxID=48709 RepID=A0A1D2ND53_ORCCI|nr:hypothetical protein Ocin01_03501 [Orchesella cincta]
MHQEDYNLLQVYIPERMQSYATTLDYRRYIVNVAKIVCEGNTEVRLTHNLILSVLYSCAGACEVGGGGGGGGTSKAMQWTYISHRVERRGSNKDNEWCELRASQNFQCLGFHIQNCDKSCLKMEQQLPDLDELAA